MCPFFPALLGIISSFASLLVYLLVQRFSSLQGFELSNLVAEKRCARSEGKEVAHKEKLPRSRIRFSHSFPSRVNH
jgi:hypothetical protein